MVDLGQKKVNACSPFFIYPLFETSFSRPFSSIHKNDISPVVLYSADA